MQPVQMDSEAALVTLVKLVYQDQPDVLERLDHGALPVSVSFFTAVNGECHSYDDADFYRVMHYSAKRGLAIACRLSVCLSVLLFVYNVGGSCSHIVGNLGN